MRFMQSRHSSSCFISLHWPHLKDRKTYILKVNCWYLLLSLTFVIVVKIWIFCILYILLWVKRNDEIKRSHDMTISMLFIIEKWKIIIQVWYWLFSCKLLVFSILCCDLFSPRSHWSYSKSSCFELRVKDDLPMAKFYKVCQESAGMLHCFSSPCCLW